MFSTWPRVRGRVVYISATHLWKVLCAADDYLGKRTPLSTALPQMQAGEPGQGILRRMHAFTRSSLTVLGVTMPVLSQARLWWERTGARIEVCVAVAAVIAQLRKQPFIIMTANDLYDEFAEDGMVVFKPSDLAL